MEEDLDDVSKIESRHRKEKKELQAHITALKKTAKNDKSKKKELTAEVARLESEQEIRHKQELQEAQKEEQSNKITPLECVSTAENEISKTKVSKAQKRRDKKSQLEREREDSIKLQEKENLNGPRNIENLAIVTKLKERNLQIFSIPSNGDCLYQAILHQLQVRRQQKFTVEELRKNVANYIKQHKDDFVPFMSNPDTFEMLTDAEFEDYCDKIRDTKVWGGQLEIKALSNCLKCPINVIQATGPDSIEQGNEFKGAPLIITYHRHMYSLGEHYNSTVQREPEDTE
ncbi:hypothetical protein K1T71_002670 [Dendrolimus kikuchii]|uniref:Uncharacterized protein n=1 Tax=Dendrolimus kikuchii TaxID=765133 RepID=A0ACC1DE91_9NEOP|nr:hypothetical protein K1T71_002670 [Dendrolimus kikuchii]